MKLLIPLFSPSTGTWGGVTRGVALYEAARRAGHQVAFCSSGGMAEGLKKHGYPVYPTPETSMFGLPAPISRILERRSQRMSLPVSVMVKNIGARAGDEVVEVYVKAEKPSVRAPLRTLAAFQRVHLAGGETKTVTFKADASGQVVKLTVLECADVNGGDFKKRNP